VSNPGALGATLLLIICVIALVAILFVASEVDESEAQDG